MLRIPGSAQSQSPRRAQDVHVEFYFWLGSCRSCVWISFSLATAENNDPYLNTVEISLVLLICSAAYSSLQDRDAATKWRSRSQSSPRDTLSHGHGCFDFLLLRYAHPQPKSECPRQALFYSTACSRSAGDRRPVIRPGCQIDRLPYRRIQTPPWG